MAKIPDHIRGIIERYIRALEAQDIHVQRAVLFGSHARGRANEWSDIDLALVSDAFAGDRFDDRSKIRRITLSVSSDLSPLPFSPEDFNPENPFVKEILEEGIRIV
ncbi:MAG: nucleotidyltransferase domain-containing protein [Deltaproteobacteria bacterium CG_4_8_14_3_um_filter_51_11]|nr:nucleotidyltransferase domain-containing protein [bacterium]OIP43151.1 MAG: nucleotidyltransferase [Desulfobacteraceae bacterium CG2_30_51_40]PIP45089.1 MAG: nucleotidyltransferase [Deltaproteobacteria bacterium CG23_combo_of_CG06-09_8_20_14_all_51_20]PIX18885.1 MAG: nucleotidyltransferase domain-containing protein [Deltaproteobacteria bacterium CG_4_8_14_3_um_filter_51_11]PIY25057.1 MAG: nucleotidyltransferase domain-containing protein [Deltaproteobacteria bacterium CG_4_10_14_3_um_filter_5